MTATSATVQRTYLALFAVFAIAATANAGAVYVWVVVDPPTTAGAGVSPIAGGGFSMIVSSNRSGIGTFHVYAVDDADNSAGLRSFLVKLNGTVSGVLNRSPIATWDNEPFFGDGIISVAGFNAPRTTLPSLGGSQAPANSSQIAGFGITASNFQAETNAGSYAVNPTSGRWGIYASGDGVTSGFIAGSSHFRNAMLLGEGFYTDAPPTVDVTTTFSSGGTGFSNWNATGFPNAGSFTTAVGTTNTLRDFNPWLDPEPATVILVGLSLFGFGGLVRHRRS